MTGTATFLNFYPAMDDVVYCLKNLNPKVKMKQEWLWLVFSINRYSGDWNTGRSKTGHI